MGYELITNGQSRDAWARGAITSIKRLTLRDIL